MKKFLRFWPRLTVFDWLVVLVVVFSLVFLGLFIFKKEKWVRVEVKIAPEQWWWEGKEPPYWLVDRIKKGDEQYDSLGRKIAEVLDTKVYEFAGGRKMAWVTLNLKAEVDNRRKKLNFNHRPLEIGKPVDLEIGKVGVEGLVSFIEGAEDKRLWEEKIVEARVTLSTNVFPETLGIFPWRAEAIKVGDEMKDIQGRVVAKVLEKRVAPAEKIVTTADGRVFVSQDPIKKDVILVVRLKTVQGRRGKLFS